MPALMKTPNEQRVEMLVLAEEAFTAVSNRVVIKGVSISNFKFIMQISWMFALKELKAVLLLSLCNYMNL